MDFSLLTVEIMTAGLGLGLLVLGLLLPHDQKRGIGYLATTGLFFILLVTLVLFNTEGSFLDGMYTVDGLGNVFKVLFLVAAILVTMASHDYIAKLGYNQGEYYALMVMATLGMMVLASAGDLITLYVGLELMTISLCILACYRMDEAKSSEAGIKYIILGALSSAILLYGLSLIYGLTGTTVIADIARALSGGAVESTLVLGTVFILAGFAFKISAVPFHMWAPDIYEGAPTPVTAFLAVASKAAGFAVLLRVLLVGLPVAIPFWGLLVLILSVLTMILGNLVAIPQKNVKRLLAYSSISQAGYLLLGVVAYSALGIGAILFHAFFYVFANVGAFGVVAAFAHHTDSDEIKDYAGLARRSPFLAAVMLFSLLSLAGIPPLAGFVSKFYLFIAIIDQGYVWLAMLAILMSMVSVYYYLLVVKAMYLGEPPSGASRIKVSGSMTVALVISMVAIFIAGIYPGPFTDLAMNVGRAFFP